MDEPIAKRTRKGVADKAKDKMIKVMGNSLLLSKIAAGLSVQDLLNLRKTDSQWNSGLIPKLREKHRPINLCAHRLRMIPLPHSEESDNDTSLENFVELMKTSSKIPFSKFIINNCRQSLEDFGPVCGEAVTELWVEWFWEEQWETSELSQLIFEQTPQLTKLELSFHGQWKPKSKSETPVVPQQLSSTIPNLKVFTFSFADQEPTACAKLISEIILRATGLESLSLPSPFWPPRMWNGGRNNGYENYTEFLCATLTHVRDFNTNIHKLKGLLIGEVNREVLQILLKLADRKQNVLRLETFSMPVTGTGWNYEAVDDTNRGEMGQILRKFLVKLSSTLKELKIWLRPWPNPHHTFYDNLVVPINLPRMEELCTLELVRRKTCEQYYGINFDLQYEGATFAASFPSLNKLSYYHQQLGLEDEAGEEEEGEDDAGDVEEAAEEDLLRISHPRVTDLKMEANLKQLVVVRENFAAVTHLDLHVILRKSADPSTSQPARLSRIWTLWPATLTHLKLYVYGRFKGEESYGPDEFLTGVPPARMPELKTEAAGITMDSLTHPERETLVNKYKTWPGISNLRRLEEFELKWSWDRLSREVRCKQLTETGVHFGLLLAGPQLKYVTFKGMERPLVSRECAPLLKRIYGHHALINRECQRCA